MKNSSVSSYSTLPSSISSPDSAQGRTIAGMIGKGGPVSATATGAAIGISSNGVALPKSAFSAAAGNVGGVMGVVNVLVVHGGFGGLRVGERVTLLQMGWSRRNEVRSWKGWCLGVVRRCRLYTFDVAVDTCGVVIAW